MDRTTAQKPVTVWCLPVILSAKTASPKQKGLLGNIFHFPPPPKRPKYRTTWESFHATNWMLTAWHCVSVETPSPEYYSTKSTLLTSGLVSCVFHQVRQYAAVLLRRRIMKGNQWKALPPDTVNKWVVFRDFLHCLFFSHEIESATSEWNSPPLLSVWKRDRISVQKNSSATFVSCSIKENILQVLLQEREWEPVFRFPQFVKRFLCKFVLTDPMYPLHFSWRTPEPSLCFRAVVRKSIAELIGTIAKHDLASGKWPKLFVFIEQYTSNQNTQEREVCFAQNYETSLSYLTGFHNAQDNFGNDVLLFPRLDSTFWALCQKWPQKPLILIWDLCWTFVPQVWMTGKA